MIVRKLQVENLRNLARVEFESHAVLNLYFHGSNGAGKTSLLEALVVLSRGRSFRTTQAAELIGPQDSTFRVFALTEDRHGQLHRLGLERSGKRWRGRMDGADLSQLSQLNRALPLVLMEPDSHLLVDGPPEVRRKYVDWGMFHVEQEFHFISTPSTWLCPAIQCSTQPGFRPGWPNVTPRSSAESWSTSLTSWTSLAENPEASRLGIRLKPAPARNLG